MCSGGVLAAAGAKGDWLPVQYAASLVRLPLGVLMSAVLVTVLLLWLMVYCLPSCWYRVRAAVWPRAAADGPSQEATPEAMAERSTDFHCGRGPPCAGISHNERGLLIGTFQGVGDVADIRLGTRFKGEGQTGVEREEGTCRTVDGVVRWILLGIKVYGRCGCSTGDACIGQGLLRGLLTAPAHASMRRLAMHSCRVLAS